MVGEVGCWVSDVWSWVLDVGCQRLDVRGWMLGNNKNIGHRASSFGH
ncbi:hypothetical protein [Aquimarina algiphila]|nr:hypothetical protein [Aquimarina algiphila]